MSVWGGGGLRGALWAGGAVPDAPHAWRAPPRSHPPPSRSAPQARNASHPAALRTGPCPVSSVGADQGVRALLGRSSLVLGTVRGKVAGLGARHCQGEAFGAGHCQREARSTWGWAPLEGSSQLQGWALTGKLTAPGSRAGHCGVGESLQGLGTVRGKLAAPVLGTVREKLTDLGSWGKLTVPGARSGHCQGGSSQGWVLWGGSLQG